MFRFSFINLGNVYTNSKIVLIDRGNIKVRNRDYQKKGNNFQKEIDR